MSSSISNYYCSLLKLYCETHNQLQAKKLHCFLIKTIVNTETFLLNNLISGYYKLGNISYARKVFDKIPQPNLFSWNNVLSLYSKSGNLVEMENMFYRMPRRDNVSWNLVISGYMSFGYCDKAVKAYKLMLKDGKAVSLNRITFSTMLILCSNNGLVGLGKQIHGQIVTYGFESYVFVGSPLVEMYAKAGFIDDARQVFDELPERNVVMYNTMIMGLLRCGMIEASEQLFHSMREKDSITWTTMVTGFAQNGLDKKAFDVFKEMRTQGVGIDQFTLGSILTACGGRTALNEGSQIHAYIIRNDMLDNVYVGSSLVDMYLKCKHVTYAEKVFSRMRYKNIITWTALIVGYGQNGHSEEAVRVYCEMQRNGIDPDEYTLGSIISSCANLASLEEGAQFHGQALVTGLISFITVSNALVTLYGKCGTVEKSNQLFNEMKIKDEVSWTALISGYSQFGEANKTINLFDRMLTSQLRPDGVTFIGVLSACSRAGLVDKGREYFKSMVNEHGIVPVSDHYSCMIDLFSRAGLLEEAKRFINDMPFSPDAFGWSTLLSACRSRGDLETGQWAAKSLQELEPQNPASYVLLSSMYAAKGKWDEVAQLRKEMKRKDIRKEPGFSWIKYKNKVHVFSADDRSSAYSEQIYAELEQLNVKMIREGYVPDMRFALHNVDESERITMLNHHSEKLAIAFGLIFVPKSMPIRVVKNLRVCGDCHTATKFISKITNREILVRDAVRFHLFKDGTCSCGDFW
ncbi:putative tetratricopeptide-like helical domain superfamily, DYW domain-containing protein [Helianthus annuus]|uniref:Putative pentatricopeptide (PPR) repeat-containing protein n=1 Tax=Helianthus annuus TaxID=4232 RepID=A0A251U7I2_HELAN|nr:putative pentatricopeptide repeat-containing protein At1g68930 [Helianthus annuus]KAF5757586.1 putative tetratricopeptide-like helical domain superfamily, DYW domain-containing protein [Helianthus annuus]KAJ0430952.1 putative tetratricopeptide-like helical domain superfamily, DYW domain-containing protein [Helianthus annuus]KAJ0436019.1 putative tetratricopeptide-like helical domain superfamily, DYW domain-containing protein [Helianthus annuus]KAJ0629855.1 putative tetratricopeptide-like hel